MKILLIEDEKDLLDSMKTYLESEGYVCETANDYQKMLELSFKIRIANEN